MRNLEFLRALGTAMSKFHLVPKFSKHDGVMHFVLLTALMKLSEVQVVVKELAGLSFVLSRPAVLPLPN